MADNTPNVSADAIIKTLDSQFIPRYMSKVNEAKYFLNSYLTELAEVEKRLAKVDSSAMRKVLGEDKLLAKKAQIEETLKKLEAHMNASAKRLTKNG